MDHLHSTATEHRKGQHLSFEHRVLIQTRLKDGYSPNRIAGETGCAPNTVRNEIKRGTVALYKGNSWATARRMISSRMSWIGSAPVSPDGFQLSMFNLLLQFAELI